MGNSGNSMVGAGRGWPAGSRQPFHIKPRAPCPAFPSALELRSETTAIAMRCPLLALDTQKSEGGGSCQVGGWGAGLSETPKVRGWEVRNHLQGNVGLVSQDPGGPWQVS